MTTKIKKISVFYDARMIAHSGIGTHIQNVLKILTMDQSLHLSLIGEVRLIKRFLPNFSGPIIECRLPVYSIREQLFFPAPDKNSILIIPHYNAPLRFLRQSIIILHDLIHLKSTEFETPHYRIYANFLLSHIARKAAEVITVSHNTQNDFLNRYPEAAQKVTVNHNGLNHNLFRKPALQKINAFRKKYSLPKKFILTVGIGKKHKNVDFVIRSLLPFWQDKSFSLPLVMGGTDGRIPDYIKKKFHGDFISQFIIVLPRITIDELPLMYAAATIMVMPSLFEGFGFPVIEAMACGTPVLSSNVASLPEVGGRAAVYFDPLNPLEFTDRLFEIINDKERLKKLSAASLKQSQKFNWEKNCRQLKKIIATHAFPSGK